MISDYRSWLVAAGLATIALSALSCGDGNIEPEPVAPDPDLPRDTSATTDRAALVALWEATDGPN